MILFWTGKHVGAEEAKNLSDTMKVNTTVTQLDLACFFCTSDVLITKTFPNKTNNI